LGVVGLGVLGLGSLFIIYSNMFGTDTAENLNRVITIITGFSSDFVYALLAHARFPSTSIYQPSNVSAASPTIERKSL
jgi:hypothetical protein